MNSVQIVIALSRTPIRPYMDGCIGTVHHQQSQEVLHVVDEDVLFILFKNGH